MFRREECARRAILIMLVHQAGEGSLERWICLGSRHVVCENSACSVVLFALEEPSEARQYCGASTSYDDGLTYLQDSSALQTKKIGNINTTSCNPKGTRHLTSYAEELETYWNP